MTINLLDGMIQKRTVKAVLAVRNNLLLSRTFESCCERPMDGPADQRFTRESLPPNYMYDAVRAYLAAEVFESYPEARDRLLELQRRVDQEGVAEDEA